MGLEELLLDRARKQGEEIGLKIGLKRVEKARLEKGKREEAIAIATKFKKMGIALTVISKGTGLPIKEIEKL